MLRRVKPNRRSQNRIQTRRRRLQTECLEDRRLLAALSFLPTSGSLDDGVLIAEAGQTVSVSVTLQARSEPRPIRFPLTTTS